MDPRSPETAELLNRLAKRELAKIARMNQPIAIEELHVNDTYKNYGEHGQNKTENIVERLVDHIALLANITHKHHLDKLLSLKDSKIHPDNYVTRLCLSEFALYPSRPLTQEEFLIFLENIEKIASKFDSNVHLVLGTISVRSRVGIYDRNGKPKPTFINYGIYVECGSPKIHTFAKEIDTSRDLSYEGYALFSAQYGFGISTASSTSSPMLSDKKEPSHTIFFDSAFISTLKSGAKFIVCSDICVMLKKKKSLQEFKRILNEVEHGVYPDYLPKQINHMVISNTADLTGVICLSPHITHIDRYRDLHIKNAKQNISQEPLHHSLLLPKKNACRRLTELPENVSYTNDGSEILIAKPAFGNDLTIRCYHPILLNDTSNFSNQIDRADETLVRHKITDILKDRFSEDFQFFDLAAQKNNLLELKRQLDHGQNINQQFNRKITALHRAAGAGSFQAVEFLLANHADISMTDDKDMTALHYAAKAGDAKSIALLFKESKNSNDYLIKQDVLGNTALHYAVQGFHDEATQYLVHFQTSPVMLRNRTDASNPLHYACQSNLHHETFEALVSKFPDSINDQNGNGDSALHLANKLADALKSKILIKSKANVNIENNKKEKAILYTIKNSNIHSFKMLIDAGSTMNISKFENLCRINCIDAEPFESYYNSHHTPLATDFLNLVLNDAINKIEKKHNLNLNEMTEKLKKRYKTIKHFYEIYGYFLDETFVIKNPLFSLAVIAIVNNDNESFKKLYPVLKEQKELSKTTNEGHTLIQISASYGNNGVWRLFLSDADLNHKNDYDEDTLKIATDNNNFFLAFNSITKENVNKPCFFGTTVLMYTLLSFEHTKDKEILPLIKTIKNLGGRLLADEKESSVMEVAKSKYKKLFEKELPESFLNLLKIYHLEPKESAGKLGLFAAGAVGEHPPVILSSASLSS